MNNTNEVVEAMNKSIKCLALELPAAIWDDVSSKWGSVLNILTPLKIDHEDISTFPPSQCLLLTTSKIWYIGDWYDGIWRIEGKNYWEFDMDRMCDRLKSKMPKECITHWLPLPSTQTPQ